MVGSRNGRITSPRRLISPSSIITPQKGVEDAVEMFLKRELETTDLQANLDHVDELEEKAKEQGRVGQAWRPTRDIEHDVGAYRYE